MIGEGKTGCGYGTSLDAGYHVRTIMLSKREDPAPPVVRGRLGLSKPISTHPSMQDVAAPSARDAYRAFRIRNRPIWVIPRQYRHARGQLYRNVVNSIASFSQ
jgi:hypothetical protein